MGIIIDFIFILKDISQVGKIRKALGNNKYVVLVSDTSSPRLEKIAFGLERNGYLSVVLYKSKKGLNKKNFSHVFKYASPLKALWLMRQFNPVVTHVFSCWNFNTAFYLIKKKKKRKIVFDDYDVLAGMVYEEHCKIYYPSQYAKEKYCLENADGLCCRSLETQYAKRILKYRLANKKIFFPEYLWNIHEKKEKDPSKKNTIVYAGNTNTQIIELAEQLQKINWKLDIYPAYVVTLDATMFPSNVTIYKTRPFNELIKTLSEYSIAIQLPPFIAENNSIAIYTDEKRIYAMSGKMYDYMEANLQVIMSSYQLLLFLLRRQHSLLQINDGDYFNDLLKKLEGLNFTANLNKSSNQKLTITEQTKRLIKFYNTVAL